MSSGGPPAFGAVGPTDARAGASDGTASNGCLEVELDGLAFETIANEGCAEAELDEVTSQTTANGGCVEVELDESESEEQAGDGEASNLADDVARDDPEEAEPIDDDSIREGEANAAVSTAESHAEHDARKDEDGDPIVGREANAAASAAEPHAEDERREDKNYTVPGKKCEKMRDPPPVAEVATSGEEAKADILDEVTSETINDGCVEVKLSGVEPNTIMNDQAATMAGEKAQAHGAECVMSEQYINQICEEALLKASSNESTVEAKNYGSRRSKPAVSAFAWSQDELDSGVIGQGPDDSDATDGTFRIKNSEWKFILNAAREDDDGTLAWSQSLLEEIEDVEGYLSCMEAENAENEEWMAGVRRRFLGSEGAPGDAREEVPEEYYGALVVDAVMGSHAAELETRMIKLIQAKGRVAGTEAERAADGSREEDDPSMGHDLEQNFGADWSYGGESLLGVLASMFEYNCGARSSPSRVAGIPGATSTVSEQEKGRAIGPGKPQ